MDTGDPAQTDLDQLFRRESGRMVATVARIFGIHNLALAEDVVQDAFCRAMEVWSIRGIPENPGAWLMATASRRALGRAAARAHGSHFRPRAWTHPAQRVDRRRGDRRAVRTGCDQG